MFYEDTENVNCQVCSLLPYEIHVPSGDNKYCNKLAEMLI